MCRARHSSLWGVAVARCPQSGSLEMGGVSSVHEERVRGGESERGREGYGDGRLH